MNISFQQFMDEAILEFERVCRENTKNELRAGLNGYLAICSAVQKDFGVAHVDLAAIDGNMVVFVARTADGDDVILVSLDELIEICEDYEED